MIYQKGDIISVSFPFTDIKGSKKRPALIISNNKINNTGDYLVVMITSKFKDDGLSIPMQDADFRYSKLPLKSYVRFHKIALLNEQLINKKVSAVSAKFRLNIIKNILSTIK